MTENFLKDIKLLYFTVKDGEVIIFVEEITKEVELAINKYPNNIVIRLIQTDFIKNLLKKKLPTTI